MNKYQNTQKLSDAAFRRQTGIQKNTFKKMVELLAVAEAKKKELGGKPNKLPLEDRVLMWLEYMREYRTYFHISRSYGISESACYRNCVWIENTLVKSKEFKLPSRKEFVNNLEIQAVVVDATESPIERPQKNKGNTTLARKSGTR